MNAFFVAGAACTAREHGPAEAANAQQVQREDGRAARLWPEAAHWSPAEGPDTLGSIAYDNYGFQAGTLVMFSIMLTSVIVVATLMRIVIILCTIKPQVQMIPNDMGNI